MSLLSVTSSTSQLMQVAKQHLSKISVRYFFNFKTEVNRELLKKIQQPIDLSPAGIKDRIEERKLKNLMDDHKFLPERNKVLGPELAAAHFILSRGGKIKSKGADKWIEEYQVNGELTVPGRFTALFKIEAIDASNTDILYNSFDNFDAVSDLQYLNLRNCKNVDDWCLDRLTKFRHSLLMLDISECRLITERGIASLHRLSNLRMLIMEDLPSVKNLQLTTLMLEETLPNCYIEGVDFDASVDTADGTDTPSFIKNLKLGSKPS